MEVALKYNPLQRWIDEPLISVIIRTHEGDRHLLPRAFTSVVNQDVPAGTFEVIVANDGPLDSSLEELVEALGDGEPLGVSLVGLPEKSEYYCWPSNIAIMNSRAPYIAHLDADNEWLPTHLSGLLKAIRTPHPKNWLPDFVFSRRHYVKDVGASGSLPVGDSPLIHWETTTLQALVKTPQHNFVDSSDFLISRSALYCLAERTGYMWNTELDRFGDWDLMVRLAEAGLRGQAVDQVTHIYHWTGKNLQVTRKPKELAAIPIELYEEYQRSIANGTESGSSRN